MRRGLAAVAAVLAVAACGGSGGTPPSGEPVAATNATSPPAPRSPELVVLDWNDALRHELNDEAAKLFAPGAVVVSSTGEASVLRTAGQAEVFNASFPCQGRIVAMSRDGDRVTATFVLGNRSTFVCAAQYTGDTATFTVRSGLIVRMEIVPD